MVGGTGLYIKASLYNYRFEEEPKKNNYDSFSNDELYEMLLERDPNTEIHKNNRKRIERALDYYQFNKEPLSSKNKSNELLYDTIFIGLTTSREQLYEKLIIE